MAKHEYIIKSLHIEQVEALEAEIESLSTENQRLRKIATHVPAKTYIKAEENAGYGREIKPN